MRNLKKILALVLALVMSLSLMATASAADTTAASDASKYQTAIDVLKGIGVVKGDDRGDRPTDNITRAEVSALLYRIATADVKDEQTSIHTGVSFTDVNLGDWYTGYISYCYIAEIIKGNPNGTFEPDKNINGYATLAMILRAMGYGKNGEFVGDGWEIRTASTAKSIGILDGISDTQLSGPAARELVFEILFRAIQKDEVKFSALYPNNYESLGTTLGQRMFGLEEITGVIKANQWANLDGDTILAADTTKMTVSSVSPVKSAIAEVGKDITLDKATDLEAVGLTYIAYMANGAKASEKVVITDLVKSDVNVDNNNDGEGVNTGLANQKYKTIKDLANGLSLDDAEYYLNYGEDMNGRAQSKWKIQYAVAKSTVAAHDKVAGNTAWTDFMADKDNKVTTRTIYQTQLVPEKDDKGNDVIKEYLKPVDCYLRSIQPYEEIKAIDIEIMKEIFYTADRIGNNTIDATGALLDYVVGEVYAGTSSMNDRSDDMAWVDFDAEFLTYDKVNKYESCNKGDSLRVIDNNGDGKAEYVLKVTYTQSKAVDTYKDELAFRGGLKMSDYTDNRLYNPDELTKADLGVIANYTVIDKKLSIWKAEIVTDIIKTKNYKDITVTTTDSDEVLGQSGIVNNTGLDQENQMMAEKVSYNMYLDAFRNIRSYEPAEGKKYALLTEMYPANSRNWTYVKDNRVVAEMQIKDADTEEHLVVKNSTNEFSSQYVWTSWTLSANITTGQLYNYLQPATAHLGIAAGNLPAGMNVKGIATDRSYLYDNVRDGWNRNVYETDVTPIPGVFNYGSVPYEFTKKTAENASDTVNTSFSFTNVATYVMDGEEVILSSASQLYRNAKGDYVYRAADDITVGAKTAVKGTCMTYADWQKWYTDNGGTGFDVFWNNAVNVTGIIYIVYAVDYVQLAKTVGVQGGRHFAIDDMYDSSYKALSNNYVNTVDSTEFYVVTPGKIFYKVGFTDYAKLNIKNEDVRAAYAVAQNTTKDANGQDYWVADVVVVELEKVTDIYESISLMYYNPYETTGNVQFVDSLNSQWHTLQPNYEKNAMMQVVPKNYSTWQNGAWSDARYGFYALFDQTLVTEGTLEAGRATQLIQSQYNAHNIYAGTVKRTQEIVDSNYIDVYRPGLDAVGTSQHVTVRFSDWSTPVYSLVRNEYRQTNATQLNLTNWDPTNGVYDGDRVIYVLDKSGNCEFIVDLGPAAGSTTRATNKNIPSWLVREWNAICDEQVEQATAQTPVEIAVKKATAAIAAAADVTTDDKADVKKGLEDALADLNKLIGENDKNIDKYTAAEWQALKSAAANLTQALAKLDVTVAKNDAVKVLTGIKADLEKNSQDNVNYDDALEAINDKIDNLKDALKAATTVEQVNTIVEDAYDEETVAAEIQEILDRAVLDYKPSEENDDADIVVEKDDDASTATKPVYDVTIPTAAAGKPIYLDFNSKFVSATAETDVAGFTASIEKVADAAKAASSNPYTTWKLTLTATGVVAWPAEGGTVTITLTAKSTGTEEPAGDYKVVVTAQGEAVEGLTISPATAGNTVPNVLTITAPEGKSLPANNDNGEVTITVNGAPTSAFAYKRSDDKLNEAKITFTVAGINNANNIYVNLTVALGTQTEVTTHVTVTGGPDGMADNTVKTDTVTLYQGNRITSLTLTGVPAGWLIDVTGITNTAGTPTSLAPTTNYTVEGNVITLKSAATIGSAFDVAVTLYKNATVTVTSPEGVTCATKTLRIGAATTSLTLTVPENYRLASTGTTATMNGEPLTVTVNPSTKAVSWVTPANITGNIVIVPKVEAKINVTLANANSNLVISTDAAKYVGGTGMPAITIGKNTAGGVDANAWILPKTATVTMGDKTWNANVNPTTGALTLVKTGDLEAPTGATEITGDITVTAADATLKTKADITLDGVGAGDLTYTSNKTGWNLYVGGALPTITLVDGSNKTAPADGDASKITVTMAGTDDPLTISYASKVITITSGATEVTGDITVTIAS